jgi:hypothetical protein
MLYKNCTVLHCIGSFGWARRREVARASSALRQGRRQGALLRLCCRHSHTACCSHDALLGLCCRAGHHAEKDHGMGFCESAPPCMGPCLLRCTDGSVRTVPQPPSPSMSAPQALGPGACTSQNWLWRLPPPHLPSPTRRTLPLYTPSATRYLPSVDNAGIFNNVAVAAAHALAVHGLKRVAIVDFDVGHGLESHMHTHARTRGRTHARVRRSRLSCVLSCDFAVPPHSFMAPRAPVPCRCTTGTVRR